MIATLKALSVLLCYPTDDIRAGAPELARAIRGEGLIKEPCLAPLLRFLDDFGQRDLYDLQERYVLLFDRTRSLSLHLFEHVHGESRERGQAMVDLAELYARHDLAIEARELPDYLPMFLEFASTLSLPAAREMLDEIAHIVTALEERLDKRESAYAGIFRGIRMLAGDAGKAAQGELSALADDDPDDLEALDRAWEDEPVTFGPGTVAPQGSCPAARDVLARLDPPARADSDLADSAPADGETSGDGLARLRETPS